MKAGPPRRIQSPGAAALCAAVAISSLAARQVAAGDVERGRVVYQACMGCHSIDEDDVGPRHRGVVGRRAGSMPGYVYSPALRASGIVWDPVALDRWLTNPQAMVPGAKMFFSLSDAAMRADVIAYLATQK